MSQRSFLVHHSSFININFHIEIHCLKMITFQNLMKDFYFYCIDMLCSYVYVMKLYFKFINLHCCVTLMV